MDVLLHENRPPGANMSSAAGASGASGARRATLRAQDAARANGSSGPSETTLHACGEAEGDALNDAESSLVDKNSSAATWRMSLFLGNDGEIEIKQRSHRTSVEMRLQRSQRLRRRSSRMRWWERLEQQGHMQRQGQNHSNTRSGRKAGRTAPARRNPAGARVWDRTCGTQPQHLAKAPAAGGKLEPLEQLAGIPISVTVPSSPVPTLPPAHGAAKRPVEDRLEDVTGRRARGPAVLPSLGRSARTASGTRRLPTRSAAAPRTWGT